LDYTEREEDFHRRGQGQVEEVEEPDRVAELVGVADEEQQLVGDQEDSYLLNCHQPGETLIACVNRHHWIATERVVVVQARLVKRRH